MPFSKTNSWAWLLTTGLVLAGCSGKTSGADGNAPRSTSSSIPAAAPRALGPGAARLEAPARTAPMPTDEPDDPFAPFHDPPEGGIAKPPPDEPLPL